MWGETGVPGENPHVQEDVLSTMQVGLYSYSLFNAGKCIYMYILVIVMGKTSENNQTSQCSLFNRGFLYTHTEVKPHYTKLRVHLPAL